MKKKTQNPHKKTTKSPWNKENPYRKKKHKIPIKKKTQNPPSKTHIEVAENIDCKELLDLLGRVFKQSFAGHDARVVNQHVDGAQLLPDLGEF